MISRTSRALMVHEADGPLRMTQLAPPEPGPGEVLVRIHASGVNPLDLKIRAGAAAHARQPFPAILGMDLAGVVEKVGTDVSSFTPGDEVWAMAGGVAGVPGSLADHAMVDARLLARKPARLTMREAAALPLVVITAWEGVVDRLSVRDGETVLVIGGAGGVGHVALQLARSRGATTFGVGGPEAAEYLRSIGATPISRGAEVERYVDDQTAGRGFDAVYDCVGALDEAFKAVRRYGRVTSSLGWGVHALAPLSFRCATYAGVFTLLPLLTGEGREAHGRILAEAAALVDAGELRPRLDDRRFTLDQAEEAHALVREGANRGKVVIELTEP